MWSLPLGRPLIPRVDALRTFWEGIDAVWLDEEVGRGYESWLEDQDSNTNGLPDGLEAFRTAALVDFTWSPYPDIGTIQYPPLAYDPAGGTIDADQDGNPDFDRDAETLPDLWEYRYQLDPRDPGDATLDPDQDGLNNLAEYLAGTHPRLADSDGDGFTDGEEWNASSPASNPLAAASGPPLVLAAKLRSMQRALALQHDSLDSLGRLQAISDNLIDAIITIDAWGKMITVNRSAELIFGWTSSEMQGQNVKMLMPEPYHSEHDGYLIRYASGEPARIVGRSREVEAIRKDGRRFPVNLGVTEISLDGRNDFIGVIRDISEAKAAEKKLRDNARQLQNYDEQTQSEQQLALPRVGDGRPLGRFPA